jgi:hypothetical protein
MSRWHKPDPPDELFPQEPKRPSGMSYREFAALQKWRHGHTLKPEDVEGLELSPDSMLLQSHQVSKAQKVMGRQISFAQYLIRVLKAVDRIARIRNLS